ncbi:PREDICTED: uncharacterized protein LOC105566916 isoform X2 [Vollenhovia emeryi]|nr:PREDICTED: uncharacterized protein LOC105566916 isoform X2 [Vollenhovia emeryi]
MAGTKSAINTLQEISIKQGYMPMYNFLERIDGGKNSSQFICNVFCKQLSANGVGSCKKHAKLDAAKKMLLLLGANNTVPFPVDARSSPSVADVKQSPASACEASPSSTYGAQPTVHCNYIGMLQEFCQQQRISTQEIVYKLVYDEGLPHLKTFTMEVQLGKLSERATAQCKKTAKQEAAKKLLLQLNPSIVKPKVASVPNADADITKGLSQLNLCNKKEELESSIRQLGTGILDCVTKKEASDKAKVLYLEHTKKKYTINDQAASAFGIKDLHMLFEKNYCGKSAHNVQERMRSIRDGYARRMDFQQAKWDIEALLEAEIQQVVMSSVTKNHIMCLRLMSAPRVTQMGIGETKSVAQFRAMCNLINAILILLNV